MNSPNSKGLLLIAHGSRRPEANLEIERLAGYLQKQLKEIEVGHSFLELSHPGIKEAANRLIQRGVKTLYLYPHFLTRGRHVTEDIPALVHSLKEEHQGVSFEQIEYLGQQPAFFKWIEKNLKEILSD